MPRADGSATEAEQKIATVSASPELTEHLVHLIRTEWRTIRQAVHGWDRRHSIPVTISGATKIPGRHYTHCLNVNTARIALAELIADHRLPGLITDSMIVSKIHSRLSDEQRATDEVVCARDPGCRRHRPSPVLGVCPRRTSA